MTKGQFGQLLCEPTSRVSMEEESDALLLKRFVSQQDEAAFAALVKRHGPMVLAVCRRVLRNAHDADDAFQATFLVLIRKAASIAQPELLGNWLYGVAYRVAVKARANAARRSEHERRTPVIPLEDPLLDVNSRELRAVLDAELSHLPEKYRVPLVLCYLEGKTNEEAARLLGWPTGSMSGRLLRAKELLRKRLVHRGLVLSVGVFALHFAKHTATVAIPDSLLDGTVRGAIWFAKTTPAAVSVLSPTVSALADEVMEAMRLSGLKNRLARWLALLILALLGIGAASVTYASYQTSVHHCSVGTWSN
jgi:HlyD family secretion protein